MKKAKYLLLASFVTLMLVLASCAQTHQKKSTSYIPTSTTTSKEHTGATTSKESTHIHMYETTYTYDGENHWYVCKYCGEKAGVVNHNYDEWEIVSNPTTEVNGSKKRTCQSCGYVETAIIEKLHTHVFEEAYSSDSTGHFHKCELCDVTTEAEAHEFSEWATTLEPTEEAFGIESRTCSICNFVETRPLEKLPHTHIPSNYYRFDVTGDWKVCEKCGEILNYEAHSFDENGLCGKCGFQSKYKISYELNGGVYAEGVTNPESFSDQIESFKLNNPTKVGYTFTGWTGSNGETPEVEVMVPVTETEDLHYVANFEAITYNITLDLAEGSGLEDLTYTIESEDITLGTPTRIGYTFIGWTGSNGETPELSVVISNGSIEDKSYTANWSIDTYTITYNLNGGTNSENNPTSYTILSDEIVLEEPTRIGYTFINWTSNGETITTIDSQTLTNYEVSANWGVINYTITYNLNGGNAVNVTSYNIETETFNLVNPTKSRYTFAGWSGTDISDSLLEVSITKGSIGDRSYVASYTPVANSITYDLTGGILPEGSTNPTSFTVESDAVTLINPTREHYRFLGWSGSNGANPSTSVSIFFTVVDTDLSYTANWEIIEYTIDYELNGGAAINPTTYNHLTEEITLTNPTKTGYNFLGWTGSNGNTPEEVVKIPTGSTGNKSYTANWGTITYSITYQLNGGSYAAGVANPSTYTIETDTFTLANLTKYEYTFNGWILNSSDTPSLEYHVVKGTYGDLTITANWSINVYDITYDLVGGVNNSNNPATYTHETSTFTIGEPTKTDFVFIGWTGSNGNIPQKNVTIDVGNVGPRSYKASWLPVDYIVSIDLDGGEIASPNNYHSVYFDSNYVGGSIYEEKVEYGTNVSYPAEPTRTGYMFNGWYLDDACTIWYKFDTELKGDLTVYAGWTKITADTIHDIIPTRYYSQTVKLSVDVESVSVNENNSTFVYFILKNDESNAKIYYRNGSTGSSYAYDIYIYNLTKNTVILDTLEVSSTNYANVSFAGSERDLIYIKLTKKVNTSKAEFYFEGLSDITSTALSKVGETYNKLSNDLVLKTPERVGYNFLGWTGSNGNTPQKLITIDHTGNTNLSYKAAWEKITYSITYDLAGGSVDGLNPTSYCVDSSALTITNPTKTGYTFLGWTGTGLTTQTTTLVIPFGSVGNRSYTANWEETVYTISYDLAGGGIYTITYNENYNGGGNTYYACKANEAITYPVNPVREGYIFTGWYTKSTSNSNEVFRFETTQYITENTTLYAGWMALPENTVDVNPLDVNQSNPMTVTTNGTIVTENNQQVEKAKHRYAAINLDGTYAIFYRSSNSTDGSKVVIKNLTTNTVILDEILKNTSRYESVSFTASAGDVIDISVLKNNSEDIMSFYYSGFNTITPITMAQAKASYKVTEEVTLFTPERIGYTFLGWIINDTDTPKTAYTIPVGTTGNMPFKAVWEAIEYTITANSDSVLVESKNVKTDASYTLNVPTKTGYTFKGYALNGKLMTNNQGVSVDGYKFYDDVTLNAVWEINKYTVTFKPGYETEAYTPITQDYNTTITEPLAPVMANKIFMGWYKEEACTNKFDFVMPANDQILYARWANVLNDITISNKRAVKVTDTITPELFNATCLDVENNNAVMSVVVTGEQTAANTISVKFIAKLDDVEKELVVNDIKVYDIPTLTLDTTVNYYNLTEDNTYSASWFNVVSKDSFNQNIDVTITRKLNVAPGNMDAFIFTATDPAGNEKKYELDSVAIYSKPVITTNNQTIFKSSVTFTNDMLGVEVKDSFGVVLTPTIIVSGTKFTGTVSNVTITATDSKGNTNTLEYNIFFYGNPSVTWGNVNVKLTDDIVLPDSETNQDRINEVKNNILTLLNVYACDSFNVTLGVEVTSWPKNALTKGQTFDVGLKATDAASNVTTMTVTIKVYDGNDIQFTYDNTVTKIKANNNYKEFNCIATDSFGTNCKIQVVLEENQVFAAGNTISFHFKATDYAGNEKISNTITGIKVYGDPTLTVVESVDATFDLATCATVKDSFNEAITLAVITDSNDVTSDGIRLLNDYSCGTKKIRVIATDPVGNKIDETKTIYTSTHPNDLTKATDHKDAVCARDGYDKDSWICSVCGYEKNEVTVISKLGHSIPTNGMACERTGCSYKLYEVTTDNIYFGSYPQSKVSDNSLITELNTKIGNTKGDLEAGWISYGYYDHGQQSAFMSYIDVDLDDDGYFDYRGVYYTSYRPNNTSNGAESETSAIQYINGYEKNNVYWFKYEKIKWNIISNTNNQVVLIADLILDSQTYGISNDNTYSSSLINSWLLTTFNNTAFNNYEKALIESDSLGLLSVQDINAVYAIDVLRRATGTDYAKANGLKVGTGFADNGYSPWITSSVSTSDNTEFYLADSDGSYMAVNVNNTSYGVRPTLTINLVASE